MSFSNNEKKGFIFKSPIGNILLFEKNEKISEIKFADETRTEEKEEKRAKKRSKVIENATRQLDEYFHGKRTVFDIPLLIEGSEFEKKVWGVTKKIPFGKVKSYSEIAEIIGKPKAYRAVANALGKNKFVIVIPCHRVTSKNGIGGFSSGLWRKKWLLKHEGVDMGKNEE
jgi:methylated-DNA-[protein]-cysteine S-methyltransferase